MVARDATGGAGRGFIGQPAPDPQRPGAGWQVSQHVGQRVQVTAMLDLARDELCSRDRPMAPRR